MGELERAILAVVSRLLSYPDDDFVEELEGIKALIREDIPSEDARRRLLEVTAGLGGISFRELRELYVATFDWKEKTGLYLTAHELGDSRKRGMALFQLRNLIRAAGFEPPEGELPDYMPMLYELLAVMPEGEMPDVLKRRLALATYRINYHLTEENPYSLLFALLMSHVFDEPAPKEMQRLEQGREKADLNPLPYPLMYP